MENNPGQHKHLWKQLLKFYGEEALLKTKAGIARVRGRLPAQCLLEQYRVERHKLRFSSPTSDIETTLGFCVGIWTKEAEADCSVARRSCRSVPLTLSCRASSLQNLLSHFLLSLFSCRSSDQYDLPSSASSPSIIFPTTTTPPARTARLLEKPSVFVICL